jgi:hypothetical protein
MTTRIIALQSPAARGRVKGLRQFLDAEQQRSWMEARASLTDSDERSEDLEQRFKYVARFERLLRRPHAQQVLEILRIYGKYCIPIPRLTERRYWSVSCLPATSDKPLVRINASWMELFTLLADGDGLRARFIVHLSDFTIDGSRESTNLDDAFLEGCVRRPNDIGHFFPNGANIFGLRVRGSASIKKFLATPRALQSIRHFNLSHMNRGRNAYQASHCYSVADVMLGV